MGYYYNVSDSVPVQVHPLMAAFMSYFLHTPSSTSMARDIQKVVSYSF